MANLEEIVSRKTENDSQWKARQQADRENLMALQDAAVMEITSSPEAYSHYLDLQGDNPAYSAGNIALAMVQDGDVTVFGTKEKWKMLGRFVPVSENGNGIHIFARSTFGKGYTLADAYDVRQTQGRPMKEVKLENDTREMESAMATLLNYAACQVVIDKELHTPAVYDPQRMEVAINPDYPDGEMFAAIATAVAHSRLHGKGYDLEQMRKETREFLDDLTARDQRMMYALVTLTHLADSEEQLEQDTEALSAIGRSHGCQFATMKHQQEDALNTVLPYGLRRIDAMRTLTTESTAVLLPFKTQEIMDTGGLYYGVNAVSRNLIICNRDAMLNGHGLYTGVSGSGKSMMAKQEIGFVGLNTDHDIIVVDPEREYGPLIRALGGEVITISASNGSYVNALDISKEYGDGRNPLVLKSEFIMSLCQQLMGAGEIGAKEKSIIDRCTANIYRKYIRRYEGDPPTLKDLYDDLMRQKEPVAHEIALALELFTTGSLNVFAHQTNIDTRNRIICYDIQDLGENLKPIGLLVMLDSILNRVIRNRQQGRYTHVYIDEIYLFFASPGVGGKSAINNYSSEFLYKCWKRFRKYYATLTGITQNVEECLLSDTARLMFANSEFLVLLNQAPTDRAELAKLLDASDAQMDYVSDAPAGHGLIKVVSCLVPFINELPRDTELYRLMTTKPGEQNA